MRFLVSSVLAASFVASPTIGFTADKREPHLHVLSKALQRRITRGQPKQLADNLDAVAIYRRHGGSTGGTASILTKPDAAGRVLMLTNHHVVLYERDSVEGDHVMFHPGGNRERPISAKVLRIVAADLDNDYAVLLVQLPPALQGLAPVTLSNPFSFDPGIAVYNPSFPRKDENESFTPKHLQLGVTKGLVWDRLDEVRLPHRSGSSGSPVFSKRTHKLLGIMTAGDDAWLGLVRPIGAILAHLDENLDRIADERERAQVANLLESAAP